jgi:hypothetical protein
MCDFEWKDEDKYREKIRSEKDLFRQPQQKPLASRTYD